MIHRSPSPRPSPLGRGGIASSLIKNPAAGFAKRAWKNPERRPLSLLPKGEGQDEGKERSLPPRHSPIATNPATLDGIEIPTAFAKA
jgi:hypothetical protein